MPGIVSIEEAYQQRLINLIAYYNRRIRRILEATYTELAQAVKLFQAEPFYTSGLHTAPGQLYLRNKSLLNQVRDILSRLRTNIRTNITEGMVSSWDLANIKNNRLVKEYTKGLVLTPHILTEMSQLNLTALRAFVNRVEAGMSLSRRLWRLSGTIKDQLEVYLGTGITTGKDAVQIARGLTGFLKGGVSSFYQEGTVTRAIGKDISYQALRLARTEMNMAFHHSDYVRRMQLPFVTGVEVYLSDSHPFEDICDSLVGEYPKGFMFGGWHPACMCHTRAILMSQDEFSDWVNSGELDSGKYINDIPGSAWQYLRERKEKIFRMKNPPYFIRDNFTDSLQLKKSVFEV